MKEDWQNPWYATWRFSRLSLENKKAILEFIKALKTEPGND